MSKNVIKACLKGTFQTSEIDITGKTVEEAKLLIDTTFDLMVYASKKSDELGFTSSAPVTSTGYTSGESTTTSGKATTLWVANFENEPETKTINGVDCVKRNRTKKDGSGNYWAYVSDGGEGRNIAYLQINKYPTKG